LGFFEVPIRAKVVAHQKLALPQAGQLAGQGSELAAELLDLLLLGQD
jgi:hypothetical protein